MAEARPWWRSPRAYGRIVMLGLLGLLMQASFAGSARPQIGWLDYEDGEFLNVATAEGPPPGHPFLQIRRSVERSTMRGAVVQNRIRAQYGISRQLTGGISAVHLRQRLHGFEKQGAGDTNLSLKFHFEPYPSLPIRLGVRQTLSLPTGYELERNGLASFTSRQNDWSGQLLVQYVGPRFSLCLNPGYLVAGEKPTTWATGGLGLAFTLPWQIGLRGEYYTRYEYTADDLESSIYAGVRSPMLQGVSVQAGLKRRLLQNEQVQPEFQLGLSVGRDWTTKADLYEVPAPRRATTGLLVHPIESRIADPNGVAAAIHQALRTSRGDGADWLAVYVRSYPAEHAASLHDVRHYELNLRILEIREGEIRGGQFPSLFRIARAETEIVAQGEVIAPDGYSVLRRSLYRGRASRHLEAVVAPESGSIEQIVTPSEILDALRLEAARELALQALRDVAQVIQERDAR